MTETTRLRQSDLVSAAERYIVGGRLNQLMLPGGHKPVISRGRGSRVWDIDGREYVDYILGSGPLILGHAHPHVVEAVRRQAAAGSTFYALSGPIIELAERIVDRVPCADLVQFCSTGGEATLYALRLARAATGRDKVLKFEGGYHGGNDYALMSLYPDDPPDYPRPQPSSGGIPRSLEAEVLVVPFNDTETVSAVVEANADRLAAIIVEPVQRVLEPEPGFLEALRTLADRYGIILVFDEVVTGFRLARGGAQERYGVIPDIAALGKILGGGYPLAAIAGRADIMELADHRRRGQSNYAFISGTLNGNPIAAAAGNATLDVLDEAGSYERLDEAGARFRRRLGAAFEGSNTHVHVLGVGPIFQVVIAETRPIDYRGIKASDSETMRRIAAELHSTGLLITAEKGYVSLAHTDGELDHAAELFGQALQKMKSRPTPQEGPPRDRHL